MDKLKLVKKYKECEENGDISKFPPGVFNFFSTPGLRQPITSKWLQNVIGTSTIHVQRYDIYAMGKRKGDRKPVFWTKMRILMRESERNVFQGNLGVEFLEGYGAYMMDHAKGVHMMRPVNIRDMVTQDISDFKKRAVIHLGSDNFVLLSEAESFCQFPFYTSDEIRDSGDNRVNCRKRKYYARRMEQKKQWPHITRKSVNSGNRSKLFKMLLPYRKNLPLDTYFDEFTTDITSILADFRNEFEIPPSDKSCSKSVDVDVEIGEIQSTVSEEHKNLNLLSTISMESIRW